MPKKHEIDAKLLVRCICEIEGGKWGDLGGAANMRRETWSDRTHLSYALSRDSHYALPVYETHVLWLIQGLRAAGIEASPARIYSAWYLGLTATIRDAHRGGWLNVADRCQNLYEAATAERP